MSSGHHEGGPRSSFALGRHVRCFRPRQPVDLYHALKTVKGLLPLVPPRTPRSNGYDVYTDEVYVVICYMSVISYMSVICLVLRTSCYMYMSVIYVCYMCGGGTWGTSLYTVRGVGSGSRDVDV
jgi:hypothetical protein